MPSDVLDRIAKREKTIILAPLVGSKPDEQKREALLSRIKKRGGDPYTQQPLLFDYLFCRLGPDPSERDTNLVIDLTILSFADFAEYVANTWQKSPLQTREFSEIEQRIPIYMMHLTPGLGRVMKNFVRLNAFSADLIAFRDGLLYF